MKVTLNIENDEELRAHIKDCIKGQVLSVVRGELTSLAKEELHKKVMAIATRDLSSFVQTSVQTIIAKLLYEKCGVSDWSSSFVQPYIEKIVEQSVSRKSKGADSINKTNHSLHSPSI